MKEIIFSICMLFAFNNVYAESNNIQNQVNELNSASIQSFGISFKALAYLADVSPDAYMPLSHLEESGKIGYIEELEKAGYIKTYKHLGLPDGYKKEVSFMNIRPLKRGEEIQRALKY